MNKVKILLVNKNLIAGGIETSLIAFVEAMRDVADIDVVLFNNTGILKNKFPQDIHIIEGGKLLKILNKDCQTNNVQTTAKNDRAKKTIMGILKKLGIRKILSNLALIGQKNNKEYDIAISFNGLDKLCVNYVLTCTKAKVKVNVIHSDMSQYNLEKNQIKKLQKFDKLICVSNSCAEILKQKYPSLSKTVDYIYNFQNQERILKSSKEFQVNYNKTFNIVSVSRLSDEKAHLRSLQIFKQLHDEGFQFVWSIVGEGETRIEIENFIKENNMDEYVFVYGNQRNPYPYIKEADILYLGSYHEAAPMVYAEAMLLGVPVITTNTSSALELVENKGFICNNTEEDIYKQFKEILTNQKQVKEKKKELKNFKLKTEEMIKKIIDWSK